MHHTIIHRTAEQNTLIPQNDPIWMTAPEIHIDRFRSESSDHHPVTTLRLLHDDHALYGLFEVQDRYVRCVTDTFGGPVYKDSCVELFVKPKQDKGYLNFEFNCGGTLLCSYISDATRTPEGFKDYVKLTPRDVSGIDIAASLPRIVDPEITVPTDWHISFRIPVPVLEKFTGAIGPLTGQMWRANAYKCADDSSHPHWASWSPVDRLNFHMPECFGEMSFQKSVNEAA